MKLRKRKLIHIQTPTLALSSVIKNQRDRAIVAFQLALPLGASIPVLIDGLDPDIYYDNR